MLIGDRREVWLGRGGEKRDREQECKGNKEKEKSKGEKLWDGRNNCTLNLSEY